jgi:hypothetical protein
LLRARSSGVAIQRDDENRLFLAGGLEARASVKLFGPVAARVGIAALVPIIRDRFTYSSAPGVETEAFRMSVVATTADLGLGVAFP